MKERFLRNSAFNFASQVAGVLFAIATSVVLARGLGTDLRGEYALVLLLPLTLTALLANGFSSTIVYSVASKAWKEDEIMPRMLGLIFWLLVIMVPVAALMLVFRETLFSGAPFALLCLGTLLIPLQVLTRCFGRVLAGKHAFGSELASKLISGSEAPGQG